MDGHYQIVGILWDGSEASYGSDDGAAEWAPSLDEAEALVETEYLRGDFQQVRIQCPDTESVFTHYLLHAGVWFKDGEPLERLAS